MPDISSPGRAKSPVAFFDLPDLRVEAAVHVPTELLVGPEPCPAPAPTQRAGGSCGDRDKNPHYFVPRALAKRWSVCVDKVLRFIQTGELRAFNVASPTSRRPRYRISIEEVRRFEEQTRSAAPPGGVKSDSRRRRKSPAAGLAHRSYF